jgi:membrane complex biogenesis BtpA family protein
MESVLDQALADARAYATGGAEALVVENYGDAPFYKDSLPPETVASLARCAAAVGEAAALPLGINALRNDARSAIGIAAAVGAAFVRINVHAGVVVTDQGLIEGRPAETLRERARLCPKTAIVADVHVKHGKPLFAESIVQAARDCVGRGGADAIVVSGVATKAATSLDDLRAVREALPDATIYAGSGVTEDSVAAVLKHADAVIVGSALKKNGVTTAPVDPARVESFVRAARAAS